MNTQSRENRDVERSPERISDFGQIKEVGETQQEQEVEEDDASEVVEVAFSEGCCSLN